MPVRIDEMTKDEGMAFEEPLLPSLARKAVLLPDGVGLTLRKLAIDGTRYDPGGKYQETTIQLENWVAEGLTELFGFEVDQGVEPVIAGQPPASAAYLGFQCSIDGGASYLVWSGSAWVPAVGVYASIFNDVATVDQRIPLLPFGFPRQVRLRVRMTPGANGIQRPLLRTTYIFNQHKMDLFEDVTRSLKRYIDATIQVPMYFLAECPAPKQTIVIERDGPGLDVQVVPTSIKAFNTTLDPGRNVNLFQSFDPDKRRVTMISPQTGQIELQFVGIPDVFIGAEDFFQVSKIPSVVVVVNRIEQYLAIRTHAPEMERSISRKVGRLQFHRLYYFIYATVRVQSSLKREACQMTEDICRILDQGDEFNSVANGDHYCVTMQQNEIAEDRVAEGLFVGAVNLKILGKCWLQGEVTDEANEAIINGTIPLVQTVNTFVGSDDLSTLNLPPYLRRVYRELQVTDKNTPGG